jgi:hypothetical protein
MCGVLVAKGRKQEGERSEIRERERESERSERSERGG